MSPKRLLVAVLPVVVALSSCTVGQYRYLEALNGETPRPDVEVEAYVAAATAQGVTDEIAEEALDVRFEQVFGQPRWLTGGAAPGTPEAAAYLARFSEAAPAPVDDPIPWVDWAPEVKAAVYEAWVEFAPPFSLERVVAMIDCESSGNHLAVNNRDDATISERASGLAQWVYSTWRTRAPMLGYEGTLEAAERFDPVANARVMMFTLATFGDGDWRRWSGHCWAHVP